MYCQSQQRTCPNSRIAIRNLHTLYMLIENTCCYDLQHSVLDHHFFISIVSYKQSIAEHGEHAAQCEHLMNDAANATILNFVHQETGIRTVVRMLASKNFLLRSNCSKEDFSFIPAHIAHLRSTIQLHYDHTGAWTQTKMTLLRYKHLPTSGQRIVPLWAIAQSWIGGLQVVRQYRASCRAWSNSFQMHRALVCTKVEKAARTQIVAHAVKRGLAAR